MAYQKTVKHGSAIVMMLLGITTIIIIASTALFAMVQFHGLALARVREQRERRALIALQRYGVACCRAIDPFEKKEVEYHYEFAHWPSPKDTYKGDISVYPAGNKYRVHTRLSDGDASSKEAYIWVVKRDDGWYEYT